MCTKSTCGRALIVLVLQGFLLGTSYAARVQDDTSRKRAADGQDAPSQAPVQRVGAPPPQVRTVFPAPGGTLQTPRAGGTLPAPRVVHRLGAQSPSRPGGQTPARPGGQAPPIRHGSLQLPAAVVPQMMSTSTEPMEIMFLSGTSWTCIIDGSELPPWGTLRKEEVYPGGVLAADCSCESEPGSYLKRVQYVQMPPHKTAKGTVVVALDYETRCPPRSNKRVLIIGPGFGMKLNPAQLQVVVGAGYTRNDFFNIDSNPDAFFPGGFPTNASWALMDRAMVPLEAEIESWQPDIIIAGSKGAAYVFRLLQLGKWRKATLIINFHPFFAMYGLPASVPMVLTQGSRDDTFNQYRREQLYNIIGAQGPISRNKRFLYYTGDSGCAQKHICNCNTIAGNDPRVCTQLRRGDQHNMASLIINDCLPRLMDAAMSGNPEFDLMKSWERQMSPHRIWAERFLGHDADWVTTFWTGEGDPASQYLVPLNVQSSEFAYIQDMVENPSPSHHTSYVFQHMKLLGVSRVQNPNFVARFKHAYNQVNASLSAQGIPFKTGVHTRWGFHGTKAAASILDQGFLVMPGANTGNHLFGKGIYFARDPEYVVAAKFSLQPDMKTHVMLLCLLLTGVPTLGGEHMDTANMPFRSGEHRYNSFIDSFSDPQVYVMPDGAAILPAYYVHVQPLGYSTR
eukprot:TRINITY_DN31533_c0_g1_i1.p1 TRINITY_DN31533_c0_g1~~TRINITY_DN31533_c0_g1_i1.p1  ORF type:complete len:679 (-),score=24.19 TRINITY_DN31533_c0_g1_i1:64-2100(-)